MDITAQTDLFFAGKDEEWAVFEALREALMARWPDTKLRVMKTCISFDDEKPYCYVSHPPKKNMRGILVSISLRENMAHPRFFAVVPVSARRFTVHIQAEEASQVDEELLELIALGKKR